MFESDERDRVALRRLAVGVAFIIAAGLLLACLQSIYSIGSVRERTEEQAKRYCEARRDCSSNSIYADIRSANADEAAVKVAVWQLILSIGGMIGVGFTVYYAHLAWREAKRSADAAHDTLVDAKNDAQAQADRFASQLQVAVDTAAAMRAVADGTRQTERAYLFPKVEPFEIVRGAERQAVSVVFVNAGRTPAIARKIGFCMGVTLPTNDEPYMPPGTVRAIDNVIDAKGEWGFQPIYIDPTNYFPANLRIYGFIEYADIFGAAHTSWFLLEINLSALSDPVEPSLFYSTVGPRAWNAWD